MNDRLLTHLRHVDLAVPDYPGQLLFYSGVWGLTTIAEDSGMAFLAAEGSPEQYIIRLRKAPDKRLDLVSFGAASGSSVPMSNGKSEPSTTRSGPAARISACSTAGEWTRESNHSRFR